MTDPVPERLLPLLRQRLDAAAGLKSSSLLYATIVFVAALPVVGPSLAGAWFAGMAILYLVEKGLGGTGEREHHLLAPVRRADECLSNVRGDGTR